MANVPSNTLAQVSSALQKPTARGSALTVQWRVLHALILREMKSRYGNRRLGFMWALIEPLLFISIFVAGFQLIGRSSQGGIAAPLFFVTGFSPFFMFRDIFSGVSGGTKGHQALLMFPQVTRMDILISKVVVNALVSISVFMVLMIGLYLIGFDFSIENPMGVLIGFSLIISLGLGIGLVLGAIGIRYDFISSFSDPLLGRPLFLTSGLFFTASMLPSKAREICLYNPLLHCIEFIRSSMFVGFESRYVDLQYVVIFSLVLNGFGLMMLGVFERQRN